MDENNIPEIKQLTIDFDKIRDIANRGIRRTYVFLGLGFNAARDTRLTNFHLTDLMMYRAVPDKVDEKTLTSFKEEFRKWIVSNGLRELVETFATFLDMVNRACQVFSKNKTLIHIKKIFIKNKGFEKKGIEGKLKFLRENFSISTNREKYLISINKARNCITHRQDKVGHEDIKGDDTFRIEWLGFDCYAETPKGEIHSLMPPYPKKGIILEGGSEVKIQCVEKVSEYKLGEIITFSPNDLGEICTLFQMATDDISKSALDYARKIGIKVHVTERKKERDT